LLRDGARVVTRAFASTLGVLLTILGYFIIPVYLYYFLLDLPRIREGMLQLVPVRYREVASRVAGQADIVLAAFVRGQLMVCLILAVLYSIGLSLIGIELALVIGSLAGILFIIPYVGTVVGMVLAVIMAYLKFHDLLHPLLCVGWFGLVQLLEGSIITPRIVGTTVGLHPVTIIVTLMVFGQLGGLLGMLVAVPVMAVMNLVVKELVAGYRSSAFFQERA
jgi:predicted PurR-regulated permease PerM